MDSCLRKCPKASANTCSLSKAHLQLQGLLSLSSCLLRAPNPCAGLCGWLLSAPMALWGLLSACPGTDTSAGLGKSGNVCCQWAEFSRSTLSLGRGPFPSQSFLRCSSWDPGCRIKFLLSHSTPLSGFNHSSY